MFHVPGHVSGPEPFRPAPRAFYAGPESTQVSARAFCNGCISVVQYLAEAMGQLHRFSDADHKRTDRASSLGRPRRCWLSLVPTLVRVLVPFVPAQQKAMPHTGLVVQSYNVAARIDPKTDS